MYNERVSELLLLNANSPIFQLFHGENKLIFNEMRMRDALYSTNMLSWIFIVLAHWNNSALIDMSPHSETLSWFRADQSLLFLLNAVCLVEKQQIQMYHFYSLWFEPIPRSTSLEASMLTITPLMRLNESKFDLHTMMLYATEMKALADKKLVSSFIQYLNTSIF